MADGRSGSVKGAKEGRREEGEEERRGTTIPNGIPTPHMAQLTSNWVTLAEGADLSTLLAPTSPDNNAAVVKLQKPDDPAAGSCVITVACYLLQPPLVGYTAFHVEG